MQRIACWIWELLYTHWCQLCKRCKNVYGEISWFQNVNFVHTHTVYAVESVLYWQITCILLLWKHETCRTFNHFDMYQVHFYICISKKIRKLYNWNAVRNFKFITSNQTISLSIFSLYDVQQNQEQNHKICKIIVVIHDIAPCIAHTHWRSFQFNASFTIFFLVFDLLFVSFVNLFHLSKILGAIHLMRCYI